MNLLFWKNICKPSVPLDIPFGYDRVDVDFSRLKLGVDNIRTDVSISPAFYKATLRVCHRLITLHAKIDHAFKKDKTISWVQEKDEFKKLCGVVALNALNKAKMDREIQVDHLAQIAFIKILTQALKEAYDAVIEKVNEAIRLYETSEKENPIKSVVVKEQLKNIQLQKHRILFTAGCEILKLFMEGQLQETRNAREANFGVESVLAEDFLTNPMLHVDDPFDDFFMIEEYDILLGHRLEDPDQYHSLRHQIRTLLKDIFRLELIAENEDEKISSLDEWLSHRENVERILNCFETRKRLLELEKQAFHSHEDKLKTEMALQEYVLDLFYQFFKKVGLIKRLDAYYEIRSIYNQYCPPLNPQQVLQFLISSRQRRRILSHLKQLKAYYPKILELKPLTKKIRSLNRVKPIKEKEYLVRFLVGFVRFHRDLMNSKVIRRAMEGINIIVDEKLLNLSRANNTLYEFLLPQEEVKLEKPIVNHVIIKSDLRGSTDITYRMKENGLNPASYFSLNFFDPITDILPVYGAAKVFIEGDAIILSICERKGDPEQWYSVARACGLAWAMVSIVQQYNIESRKYELPILEIGVGISFSESAPAFLFDGDQRIMISPAINLADRLSGCSKLLRHHSTFNQSPFNLYVFQEGLNVDNPASVDNTYLRYNVNGIELNPEGFSKLSGEIDLKPVKIAVGEESHQLHTGKFPLMNGKYQRLIIREAKIQILNPADMGVSGTLDRNYYEVCTDQRLYEYLKIKKIQ